MVAREFIVGSEDKARGAVLAEARDLVLLQHAEGFGRVVRALHIGGIEDVAQLVTRKAVGTRVPSVELGAELCAAVLVPGEGRAFIAQVVRKRRHGVAGVSEFEDARNDEGERTSA